MASRLAKGRRTDETDAVDEAEGSSAQGGDRQIKNWKRVVEEEYEIYPNERVADLKQGTDGVDNENEEDNIR